MAVSVQWGLAAALQAGSTLPGLGSDGGLCLPGFCPVPVQGGLPGGMMYLAIGLVWLGIAGLRHERQSRREPPKGG